MMENGSNIKLYVDEVKHTVLSHSKSHNGKKRSRNTAKHQKGIRTRVTARTQFWHVKISTSGSAKVMARNIQMARSTTDKAQNTIRSAQLTFHQTQHVLMK